MDISDFYATFFEEAGELLADMERQLLDLDIDMPDPEQLNAIFRAAHSIKGGAATFGFDALQQTTHLLENLLDHARHEALLIHRETIDIFLSAKDTLQRQLDAYRNSEEPDEQEFAAIREKLEWLASRDVRQPGADPSTAKPLTDEPPTAESSAADPEDLSIAPTSTTASEQQASKQKGSPDAAEEEPSADNEVQLLFTGIDEQNRTLLIEELEHLREVKSS